MLAFDSGFGNASSFGIGEFFLLCPSGGLEAFLASKAFLPVTAISLAVVLVLALLFGIAIRTLITGLRSEDHIGTISVWAYSRPWPGRSSSIWA